MTADDYAWYNLFMLDRKKLAEPIIYVVLIIALLAPRLPGLASFATLDEPYWLSMGANFYYALGQREFQNTVYEYQPAVTTMWIITAAMLVYFPEYRGFGQGYPSYNKGWLDLFLIEHGKHPLELLQVARVIQVFVIAILFLILYYFLRRFVNKYIAAFAVLFASFDPFFLSQSRMLDHEAMLSLFVMISVLALLAYLSQGRRFIFLLISGIAAGLAQLTKSSALAILAPVGILFLIQVIQERGQGWGKSILSNVKIFLIWLGLLVAAYFIFWPGMWVAPKKMLYEVYGNAFSYAFQGGRLAVTGELDSSQFSLDFNLAGIRSLAEMILRRTTPLTWLGILFGFALLKQKELIYKMLFALLWVTAAAFIVMFGIAQGRNSPHYILCSYLALNLLAGLGWFTVVQRFSNRVALRSSVLLIALALQLWSAIPFYPYYYTYENPLLYRENADVPLFPYGEGLELAGQYLSTLPDAQNSTALVYYSRGCFSYFYPGTTVGFKNYYTDGNHPIELLNALTSADYVVVYYAVQGHLEKYAGYVQALSKVKPIREVWIDGRKYVLIYRVEDIPESVLDELRNLKPLE
jgi:hypothetical protein